MSVRLQEVDPAIVHFPIAILPLAIGADLVGRLTRNEGLRNAGRTLMPIAGASAALSAATGLVAWVEHPTGLGAPAMARPTRGDAR